MTNEKSAGRGCKNREAGTCRRARTYIAPGLLAAERFAGVFVIGRPVPLHNRLAGLGGSGSGQKRCGWGTCTLGRWQLGNGRTVV